MVKSMNDLIGALKLKFGEDNSDDTISILEDVTDTLTDYESKVSDKTDWKKKYEENDADWRKKYIERFSGDDVKDEQEKDEEEKTFDDLFTEREG